VAKPLQHGCVRAHALAGHAAMGCRGPAGTQAVPFKFFSKSAQNLKFKTILFLMSKIRQILQVDSLKHMEKFYFLEPLQNPTRLNIINLRTNSNLNLP
jgi:hypothetical protein